jgi:HEPN domain-containing protein
MSPSKSLAKDYFERAVIRLAVVELLVRERAHADAVRESQECLELALKGLLRSVGVEPPKWHDVSKVLLKESSRLPQSVQMHLERICRFSGKMRRDRDLSFYGEEDFLPTEQYDQDDSSAAYTELSWVLDLLKDHFEGVE